MINKHLTNDEIQQYALQPNDCNISIIEHIRNCENCKIKATQYKFLFEGIKEQEKPAFDFNLQDLILKQLPKPKPKISWEDFLVYVLTFAVFGSIGLPAYLFRGYLLKMVSGFLPIVMYLIIITTIGILLFQGIEIYRKYQKQISALN
jgi:hypothetical protein